MSGTGQKSTITGRATSPLALARSSASGGKSYANMCGPSRREPPKHGTRAAYSYLILPEIALLLCAFVPLCDRIFIRERGSRAEGVKAREAYDIRIAHGAVQMAMIIA